jgi:cadmium resistance protein CadD (predicted permease)
MTQEPRSIRRLILGILSLALGIVSLDAFFSVTYIAGIGFLGGFYGLILIALGVGLILPKKEPKKEETS